MLQNTIAVAIAIVCSVGLLGGTKQHASLAEKIFKRVVPSVVAIDINGGSGSGFLVSADGRIVTCYHVIAHTKKATVRLGIGDAFDDVEVLDLDKRKDIAIIKIKAIELPFLDLGESAQVEIGATVYSVSNPEGYKDTLSQRLISGIRNYDGYRLFQTTAPGSHGSSGGPLLNEQGQVIGISSSGVEIGQNLNFAIPIDYVRGMLASPAQPRSPASIYDPSAANFGTTGKHAAKPTLLEQGKFFGQALGQVTLALLTCWFGARMIRRLWRKSNEPIPSNAVLEKLWIRLGLPALLCVAFAIAFIAIAELCMMPRPQ
jgi:S1-C subfamily serine protease